MSDYIERQAAIDAVNHALDRETLLYSFVRKVAISALKRLPAADVVPVVRCKDCKFCCRNDAQDWYWCERGLVVIKVRHDDFCSHGKRREE